MAVFDMRSTDQLVDGERPMEWKLGINELYPNANPLTHVLYRMGKKSLSDSQFHWWERTYAKRELTYASGAAASATAGDADTGITVGTDEAYNVVADTLILNCTTLEVALVTADPASGTAFNVIRGMGATGTLTDWTAGDKLQVIGQAHAEGDSVPTAIAYDPVKKYNYLEIFRRASDNTRTALKTRLRTKALKARAQKETLLLHETEKEWAFLFGKPFEQTGTGRNSNSIRRGTGGILHFAGHTLNCSGSLTMAAWRGFVYDVLEDGADEKMLVAGSGLMQTLETMFAANSTQFREVPEDDAYGLRFKTWYGAGGKIQITEHKLMTKSSAFNDWGFIIDPSQLEYKFLDDTNWLPNRQSPGDDRNIGEYLAEVGLEVMHGTECFGVIKDATAYSAS